jgi:hypothetical protein
MAITLSRFAVTAASTILTTLVSGLAHAQSPQCPSTITACGCTIETSGTYTVANDLYASQGLTPRNGCIDIKSSNVDLFVDSYKIIGTGSNAGCDAAPQLRSGVGIHVLPGAYNILVEGEAEAVSGEMFAFVCGWNYGVESSGSGVYWRQFGLFQNGIGMFLNKAAVNTTYEIVADDNVTGVRVFEGFENLITLVDAENNAHYGFWIDGTKSNNFSQGNGYSHNVGSFNGIAGFYIGCSATGDIKSTAPCVTTDNTLEYNSAEFNRFYGIAVERGSVGNLIEDNGVLNQPTEIIDGNGTCKDNTYRHNGAPCVH